MAWEIPVLDMGGQARATLLQYRVVLCSSGGAGGGPGLKHTTGTAITVRPLGVAQNAATTALPSCAVRVYGVTKVAVSTAAVATGQFLRCTSGAVSTASNLGGTVRNSSVATQNVIGIALSSAAAAAAGNVRLVSMLITHQGLSAT